MLSTEGGPTNKAETDEACGADTQAHAPRVRGLSRWESVALTLFSAEEACD